jgi:peptidoglycan hydrolase CwlO-like protein
MKDKEVELLPLLQKVDSIANDVKLLIERLKQMDKDIKELKQDILEI